MSAQARVTTASPTTSLLGQTLKEYRKEHGVSQEELAVDLNVDVRTVRRYESGRGVQENVRELRRIAGLLGVAPERLGLARTAQLLRSPEEIDQAAERIWSLVDQSRIVEAQLTMQRLLDSIAGRTDSASPELLRALAHAYHAAGYVTAVGTRSYEASKALPYYHQVEVLARELQDATLLNIGLTYQGDMHQRMGALPQAIEYLEAARETKGADISAIGNGVQLLGRAYLRQGNLDGFERTMMESAELSTQFDPATSLIRGHYNLGTVYEEYGRSYAGSSHMGKALEFLDKAQALLPANDFWELCILTARAIALVKGGEYEAGVQLAVEATEQCLKTGNVRFLDRIYIIQQHVDRLARQLSRVSAPLREALDGRHDIEF